MILRRCASCLKRPILTTKIIDEQNILLLEWKEPRPERLKKAINDVNTKRMKWFHLTLYRSRQLDKLFQSQIMFVKWNTRPVL